MVPCPSEQDPWPRQLEPCNGPRTEAHPLVHGLCLAQGSSLLLGLCQAGTSDAEQVFLGGGEGGAPALLPPDQQMARSPLRRAA